MSLTKKGNIMTEQEFKQALDKVVLEGINKLGPGVVLGGLAIVSRFTEVVYDMNTVANLQAANQKAAEESGSLSKAND